MYLLRVHAGPHARRACPVSVLVDLDPSQSVSLYQAPGHRPRFCQLEATSAGTRLWWMLPRLDAGQSMDYRLAPMPQRKKPAARLRCQRSEGEPKHLRLTLDRRAFAVFDGRESRAFPGLYPIYAPGDPPERAVIAGLWYSASSLTPSHRGTRVKPSGEPMGGPVLARLATQGVWLGPKGEQILEEFVRYTFYATPAELRLFDIAVSLRASFGPVIFGSEGLMHVQLESELTGPEGLVFVNGAGGIGKAEVEGRRAAWLHVSGRTAVAIFDHPDNPGSPCAWHVGEGRLISPLPFGGSALAAGEVLTFRYRLCLRNEDENGEAARRHYLDYAFPPRVELLETHE